MKVTVCIGSSCQVVEGLQKLIADNGLKENVVLGGTLCIGNCRDGVCVTVNDSVFSVSPDTVEDFFKTEVLAKV